MELSNVAPLARLSTNLDRGLETLEDRGLPRPANDHAVPPTPGGDRLLSPTPSFPSDTRAMIRCPAPSAASSGRAHTRQWVLEFVPRSAQFIEPLMGWTGGADPLRQVRLRFPSRDAAIAYARRQGLTYEVQEPSYDAPEASAGSFPRVSQDMHRNGGSRIGPAANEAVPVPPDGKRIVA